MAYYNYKCRMCGKIYHNTYSNWDLSIDIIAKIIAGEMPSSMVTKISLHTCDMEFRSKGSDIGISDLIGISKENHDMQPT